MWVLEHWLENTSAGKCALEASVDTTSSPDSRNGIGERVLGRLVSCLAWRHHWYGLRSLSIRALMFSRHMQVALERRTEA